MSETQSVPKKIECSVCCGDADQECGETIYYIDTDPLCEDCWVETVRTKFEDAVESNMNYPPRWGKTVLSIHEEPYNEFFDYEFAQRFLRREHEYETPLASRVYCKHIIQDGPDAPKKGEAAQILNPETAAVSGQRTIRYALNHLEQSIQKDAGGKLMECGMMVSDRWGSPNDLAKCYRCSGFVCHGCGLPVHDATDLKEHVCSREDSRTAALAALEKEGQILGRDIQLCPNKRCGSPPVALQDGCNAMVCAYCLTHFCFLCGEEAHHDSDHFRLKCPRFGRPEGNHIFDRADAPARLGADEELEEGEILEDAADIGAVFANLINDLDRHIAINGMVNGELGQEWIDRLRDLDGNEMFQLIGLQMVELNRRQQEHAELVEVLRELGMLWNDPQANGAAVNQPADAREGDLLVRLRGIPRKIFENTRVIDGADMRWDLESFEALNPITQLFIERHDDAADLIAEVGDQMATRFPRLQAFWHRYLNKIPAGLRNALNGEEDPATAARNNQELMDEIHRFTQDPAVLAEWTQGAPPIPLWLQLEEVPFALTRLTGYLTADPPVLGNELVKGEFVADHKLVAEAITSVGQERFAQALPVFKRQWEAYVAQIPENLLEDLELGVA